MTAKQEDLEIATSAWTPRLLVRAAMVASFALGVGAWLGYLVAHEPVVHSAGQEPERPALAGAAELAVVAPLGPGAALADFAVTEILAVRDGALRVVCEREAVAVALDVALAAEGGPTPPAVAGRYAIFYALRGAATHEEGARLAAALAAVLRANEGAATPAGMGPYRPGPPRSTEPWVTAP